MFTIRIAELTEGVRLRELIAALQPDPQVVNDAFTEILTRAASINPYQNYLEQWEPVIAMTIAAATGDGDAADELAPVLDELGQTGDWATLAGALRRILDGERGDDLLTGLDGIDTAIATEVLARLSPS